MLVQCKNWRPPKVKPSIKGQRSIASIFIKQNVVKEKEEAIDPDDPEVVTFEEGNSADKEGNCADKEGNGADKDGNGADKEEGNSADKDPKGESDEESSGLKINIRKAGGRFFINSTI